jgi:hypothetical protein
MLPLFLSVLCAVEAQPLHLDVMVNDMPTSAIHSTAVHQELSFGTFYLTGGGGAVSVSASGIRNVSGNVHPITSWSCAAAVLTFESTSTNTVTVDVDDIFHLSDGNGGSLELQINSFHPGSTFTPVIGSNEVRIGGTITVISGASSGSYGGSFRVTLHQQ